MYWFKKMIETVRTSGLYSMDMENAAFTPIKPDIFFEPAELCQPFVFAPKNEEPISFEEHVHEGNAIDPPFDVVSIEMLGLDQSITVAKTNLGTTDREEAKIECIMNVDLRRLNLDLGTDYVQFILLTNASGFVRVGMTSTMGWLVQQFMDRINAEQEGLEHVRDRVKLGTGSTKRSHTIRQIIHISPKKNIAHYEHKATGRTIDFTHRFLRRGHWRNFYLADGTTVDKGHLGKDRSGEYVEYGRTWVMESIVNADAVDKPLVTKLRMVR